MIPVPGPRKSSAYHYQYYHYHSTKYVQRLVIDTLSYITTLNPPNDSKKTKKTTKTLLITYSTYIQYPRWSQSQSQSSSHPSMWVSRYPDIQGSQAPPKPSYVNKLQTANRGVHSTVDRIKAKKKKQKSSGILNRESEPSPGCGEPSKKKKKWEPFHKKRA